MEQLWNVSLEEGVKDRMSGDNNPKTTIQKQN